MTEIMSNKEIAEIEEFIAENGQQPFDLEPKIKKLIDSLKAAKKRLGIVEPEEDERQLKLGLDEDLVLTCPVLGD